MHVTFNDINDLIVDAEIRQNDYQKKTGKCSSQLTISIESGQYIFLDFKSPETLTAFCKKHNFQIEDRRDEK